MAVCSSSNSRKRDNKKNSCCFRKVIFFKYSAGEYVFLHRLSMSKGNGVNRSAQRVGLSLLSVSDAQYKFTYQGPYPPSTRGRLNKPFYS